MLSALLCLLAVPISSVVSADPGAREPQIAAVDDRIYVAYGLGDAIGVAVSSDGKAFTEAGRINGVAQLALGHRRGPRIAASGNTIVVSAIAGGDAGDLLAWRSTDAGKTWGRPVRVNDAAAAAREGLHAMTARPDGRLVCAWLDLRGKQTQLFASQSADGGLTWSKNRVVYRRPTGSICECCHPTLVAHRTELYAMFRNSVDGARDMYFAPLADDLSPIRAEKLGRGTWALDACPMDGGSASFGTDGFRTVWRRDSTVYYSRPGKPEVPLGSGEQPVIATVGKTDTVLWLERRGGRLLMKGPGSDPEMVAERADDPVVAAIGNRVLTVWCEPKSGVRARVLSER